MTKADNITKENHIRKINKITSKANMITKANQIIQKANKHIMQIK